MPNQPTGDDVTARGIPPPLFGRSAAEPSNRKSIAHQIETLSSSAPPPPSPIPPDPPSPLADPPPPPPPASISRPPVRYTLPAAPSELPSSEAELEDALRTDLKEDLPADDAPRSLRPGQKGFAERLMSKYGWSKGSGLGASGSGIVNPLRVQIEKQRKKPDSEGGGFVGPGGRGKIIGGKKKGGSHADTEDGKFGVMSEIVVLKGMVDGMDLDAEMEGAGDGGIMQEIGEECGDKVGDPEIRSSFVHLLTTAVRPRGESLHRSQRYLQGPSFCQIYQSIVGAKGMSHPRSATRQHADIS